MGTVRVKLRAGERIDLRLECGFKKGEAAIALSHDTPGLDRRAILPEFLHPEPGPKSKIEVCVEKRPELIADFGFEEKDGALSRSRAGVEIFGRLTGNARRVPGKAGSAIELEGRSEYDPGLFPIDEELRLPDADYTVAFWFRTASPNARLCEATRYSSYNNRWSDHIVSLDQGRVRFQLQGDNALEAPGAFADSQWHHVATAVGGGGQRLYVDGKPAGTGKLSRRTRTSNRLGLDLGPGAGPAVVALDELRILGKAATPADVEAMFRNPTGR
jgi:sialidase-1